MDRDIGTRFVYEAMEMAQVSPWRYSKDVTFGHIFGHILGHILSSIDMWLSALLAS
jgi:hypothetical protein